MKRVDFSTEYTTSIALALGFFDCIHLGHRALIEAAKSFAEKNNCRSAVLTFDNDINLYFGGEKQIYTFDERALTLRSLGVDTLISAHFDDAFAKLAPDEFFDVLTKHFDIKALFVGGDYSFGRDGQGDVKLLEKLCKNAGIELSVLPFETVGGKKISTSQLKNYVKFGDVSSLNALLCAPYLILGRVEADRHVGRSLGFPTANIQPDSRKLPLKDGIYASKLTVDGKTYVGMTNIGGKPTFGIDAPTIETYLFDFEGDLYGKDVELRLFERTRDVQKFSSPEELKAQLTRDEEKIRKFFGNRVLKTIE